MEDKKKPVRGKHLSEAVWKISVKKTSRETETATHWNPSEDVINDISHVTVNKLYLLEWDDKDKEDYIIDDNGDLSMIYLAHKGDFLCLEESDQSTGEDWILDEDAIKQIIETPPIKIRESAVFNVFKSMTSEEELNRAKKILESRKKQYEPTEEEKKANEQGLEERKNGDRYTFEEVFKDNDELKELIRSVIKEELEPIRKDLNELKLIKERLLGIFGNGESENSSYFKDTSGNEK